MVWQLGETIPHFTNLQASSVSSSEFLLQTDNLVIASCLPINVPENIYFKIFRRRAKCSGIVL